MNNISFIKYYANKIGFKLNGCVNEHDILSEAYLLTHENKKDIKHNISNILYIELRKHIASQLMFKNIPAEYEKKCKECGEYKNHIEFRKKFDKVSNLTSLHYLCKPCEQEYKNKWLMNKYYNDPEYNEKMKQNSKMYKLNNKEKVKLYNKEYQLRIKQNKIN